MSMLLRVVVYKEDGLWVAHSLEMDVIGCGTSPELAVEELKGNVEAQLSFAKFKKINPFRPAPESILKIWDDANLKALGFRSSTGSSVSKSRSDGRKKHSPVLQFLQWNQREVSRLPSNRYQVA